MSSLGIALTLVAVCGVPARSEEPAVVALRFGEARSIPSPDGKLALQSAVPTGGAEHCPGLVLRSGNRTVRPVLEFCRTARVGWAPDGTAFFVNDERSSDSTVSYIFDAVSLRRVDVSLLIREADAEARELSAGHAYFDVERWEAAGVVRVRLHGHTDINPVRCFVLEYWVSRQNIVTKITRYVGEPGDALCDR